MRFNPTFPANIHGDGTLQQDSCDTRMQWSETMPEMPPISDVLPDHQTSPFYCVGAAHDTPQAIVNLLN